MIQINVYFKTQTKKFTSPFNNIKFNFFRHSKIKYVCMYRKKSFVNLPIPT